MSSEVWVGNKTWKFFYTMALLFAHLILCQRDELLTCVDSLVCLGWNINTTDQFANLLESYRYLVVRAGKEIYLLGIRVQRLFWSIRVCRSTNCAGDPFSCNSQSPILHCQINHLLRAVNHPFDLPQAAYWASDWHSPSFNHKLESHFPTFLVNHNHQRW